MDVHFVDTTFRDGSQSLWAMGMRHGMMEAVAEDLDHAGFDVIEIPSNAIHFKKIIRDLKENPWDMMRMLARKMPNTPKSCMGGGTNLSAFGGVPSPPALGELFWKFLVDMGALNRVQTVANTADQIKRSFASNFAMLRRLGLKIAVGLSYCVSPRHTDEHYAQKTRETVPFKPDVIYLKDQGGLLTVDRIRTLLPVIVQNAEGIPVELHSHCTTGLAPLVYLEALKIGVPTLHTGVPPLANGSAQPSVLNVARNAKLLGHTPVVDLKLLEKISARLTAIAKQDDMPIGAPLAYDYAQYVHQVPGGVISNLKFQLAEIRMEHRLDDVLQECVRIHRDLGYPIMITPYSQYVGTQAAINVATGERYKVVIDELIRMAQGAYGEDSGYLWMDQNLRDKLLSMPRAAELAARQSRPVEDISLKEIREKLAGPGVSDEELIMRVIMGGDQEIEAMRAAGPPRQYFTSDLPIVTLLEELRKHNSVRYVQVQRGGDSLVIQNRSGNGHSASTREQTAAASGAN